MGTGQSAADETAWLGVWGEAGIHGTPYLEFFDDHRLAGTDGCNRLIGGWTAKGDAVEFGQLASTMMFCEGVDTWLSQAATATRQGATLTVLNDAGTPIGTLKRSVPASRTQL